MGQGGTYKCNKCGYQVDVWTGIGFLYPVVCEENTEKAKKGELGEDLKRFFDEHPDGKLDCSNVLVRCEECGEYEVVTDLGMYIPKEGAKPNDTIWDLDGYKRVGSYKHVCSSCGGAMKAVKEGKDGFYNLVCPHCGKELELAEMVEWD